MQYIVYCHSIFIFIVAGTAITFSSGIYSNLLYSYLRWVEMDCFYGGENIIFLLFQIMADSKRQWCCIMSFGITLPEYN